MKSAYKSDIGRVRTINEDRAAVLTELELAGRGLAVVADGMGGHRAGDTASQLAIDTIQQILGSLSADLSLESCQEKIDQAIASANHRIYQSSLEHEELGGMGTTVVVALVTDRELLISHVGDSRAYLWRESTLEQLTEDHSLVNELVKSGQISPEEAERHPRRNVLTQALGTESNVKIENRQVSWERGNVLLLCSDGLTNRVSSKQITEVIGKSSDLEAKVEELVELALQAGGDDNITVVLLANEDAGQSEGEA